MFNGLKLPNRVGLVYKRVKVNGNGRSVVEDRRYDGAPLIFKVVKLAKPSHINRYSLIFIDIPHGLITSSLKI